MGAGDLHVSRRARSDCQIEITEKCKKKLGMNAHSMWPSHRAFDMVIRHHDRTLIWNFNFHKLEKKIKKKLGRKNYIKKNSKKFKNSH